MFPTCIIKDARAYYTPFSGASTTTYTFSTHVPATLLRHDGLRFGMRAPVSYKPRPAILSGSQKHAPEAAGAWRPAFRCRRVYDGGEKPTAGAALGPPQGPPCGLPWRVPPPARVSAFFVFPAFWNISGFQKYATEAVGAWAPAFRCRRVYEGEERKPNSLAMGGLPGLSGHPHMVPYSYSKSSRGLSAL
jgi:hypothetical protein